MEPTTTDSKLWIEIKNRFWEKNPIQFQALDKYYHSVDGQRDKTYEQIQKQKDSDLRTKSVIEKPCIIFSTKSRDYNQQSTFRKRKYAIPMLEFVNKFLDSLNCQGTLKIKMIFLIFGFDSNWSKYGGILP